MLANRIEKRVGECQTNQMLYWAQIIATVWDDAVRGASLTTSISTFFRNGGFGLQPEVHEQDDVREEEEAQKDNDEHNRHGTVSL